MDNGLANERATDTVLPRVERASQGRGARPQWSRVYVRT